MKYLKRYEKKNKRENLYLYQVDDDELLDAYEYLLGLGAEPRVYNVAKRWNTSKNDNTTIILFKDNNVNRYIINRSIIASNDILNIHDINDENEIKDAELYLATKKYNL